jgi:hypothetical protein
MRFSSRHSSASRPKGHRFTETLQSIEDRAAEGPITFGELLAICGPQGHGFVALFLVLPFLQPIPLPGISSAIGIVLAIIGVFVALRRPPWLPERVARVKVEPEHVLRICHAAERLLTAIEHVVKPRMQWLFGQRWFRLTNGFVWIVHALVFSLPLPIPFSNSLPAIVILLMALGILEEDFGVIVVAYVGAIVNVVFFGGLIAIPTLGWKVLSN